MSQCAAVGGAGGVVGADVGADVEVKVVGLAVLEVGVVAGESVVEWL